MTRKLPPEVLAVHKAWGPGFRALLPTMGPLEGNVVESAEGILHELCHAAVLGNLNPKYGRCLNLADIISEAIEALPEGAQRQNEINTIAAESLVLDQLGLHVYWGTLVYLGTRNTRLSKETFDRRAEFAKTRPHVKLAAKRVISFIKKKKPLVGSIPKGRS